MSIHTALVCWSRGKARFSDNRYSRVHEWKFDGGATVRASSSPAVIPVPLSATDAVDPEEAFVASLASCHMLWFLAVCAKQGFVVDTYSDDARGTLARDGRMKITHVLLRPHVLFSGNSPTEGEHRSLHRLAHESCYLSSSVNFKVEIEPSMP